MSEREVVGRLGRALLTEEATEDDVARVLVALGGPVPEPAAPLATPGAPGTEPTTEDLAPTGVWVDPDELARSVSPAEASGASEEVADDPGLPRAATADEAEAEFAEAAVEAAVLHAEARRYPAPEPGSGRRRRRPGAGPLLPRTGATAASSASAAARLGRPPTKFNRKLDNVCEKLDRVGVRGLRGGRVEGAASNRRTALVEHAVSTLMVTAEDLPLLDDEYAANQGAKQESTAPVDGATTGEMPAVEA